VSDLVDGFGRAVRHFREVRGWSQEFLAEKADLNRSYLGEVERGQVIPSLETAGKLAGALGISMSRLFFHCEQRAA
jgi:transcriptional regulator with XRE-family HTH domain